METLTTRLINSSYIGSSQIVAGLKVGFMTAVLALILGALNSILRYGSKGHGNPVARRSLQVS